MTQPILYVEDEEDYQILVRRILKKTGWPVLIAETSQEGWDALHREKPSLLILDINLPDSNGYTLCRRIRQEAAWMDLPILMLTVRRRPEEWLEGFAAGADDYVSKPLNPSELTERVIACMQGKQRRGPEGSTPEFQMVQSAAAGNRGAYEVLMQKHKERLVDNVTQVLHNPVEVEDLVSDTFARAYEHLGQFRGEASFYTWLYRIAANDSYRYKRRHSSISLEDLTNDDEANLPEHLAEPDQTAEELSVRLDAQKLVKAFAYVPKPYRKMLQWHFVNNQSCRAIAKRLGIPAGTVMSRLFKARRLLKDAWSQKTSP